MFGIVMPWTKIRALENSIDVLGNKLGQANIDLAKNELKRAELQALADSKQTELDKFTRRWNEAQPALTVGRARMASREIEKAKMRAKTAADRAGQ